MSYVNFPEFLMDSVNICAQGHAILRPTPEIANTAKCPKCSGAQANAKRDSEPTPRSLDPEPWATGYGGQRAKESRQRGIERRREARRAAS